LAQGFSLEAIGDLAGKHPSTVSYWLKKHDLEASGAGRHAPKGGIDQVRLQTLVAEGKSIREIADALAVGYSTIRHRLRRLGLETEHSVRRKESEAARIAGLRKACLRCPAHGHTTFFLRTDGGFRCVKCSIAAVSERRRQIKRTLVDEAGGCCRLCGFSEHQSALQFHHLDPSERAFICPTKA
jgi:transposase-like protein